MPINREKHKGNKSVGKRTRKPLASQVDPKTKEIAKQLKKAGVLSKRVNLRKKVVSRHVAKKVQEFAWIANNHYKAVKATPEQVADAGKNNYRFVGKKIVVSPRRGPIRVLNEGGLAGMRPIPGGMMHVLHLPYSSMTEFLIGLRKGEIDQYKEPDDTFAFTFYGNQSLVAFRNGKELLQWLLKYDSITSPITGSLLSDLDKTYSNFILYRIEKGAQVPSDFEAALKAKAEKRRVYQSRNDESFKRRRGKHKSELSARALEAVRSKDAAKKKRKRDRMSDAEREAYNARARERVARNREKKKDK